MSSTTKYKNMFYRSLLTLLRIIHTKVPENGELKDAIRAVKDCETMTPITLIRQLHNVVEPFKKEILRKDEVFFQKLDLNSLVGDQHLRNILKFKDFWINGVFDSKEKRDIWDLLIIIVRCCDKLLNK